MATVSRKSLAGFGHERGCNSVFATDGLDNVSVELLFISNG